MYKLRYIIFIVIICAISPYYAVSEIIKQKDIKPFIPSIYGMGNGQVVYAKGLSALWTNPAGLANDFAQIDMNNIEVTAFALSFRTTPLPTKMVNSLSNIFEVSNNDTLDNNVIALISDEGLTSSTSLYGGLTWLTQYGGFGGAIANTFFIESTGYHSLFNINTTFTYQTEFMLGYAYPINFYDVSLYVGAALRPFFRSESTAEIVRVFNSITEGDDVLQEVNGLHGFGLGADVGVQLRYHNILFGTAVRDIYTQIFYSTAPTFEYFGGQTTGSAVTDTYLIPLSFDIGVGYELIPSKLAVQRIFNVLFYFQITDVINNTSTYVNRTDDYLKHLHFGAEFRLLPPYFTVQAGISQGYPTFGMGVNVWIIDISVAVFGESRGAKIGQFNSAGFGMEFAIRW